MQKIRKSGALSVFLTKDYTWILPFISSSVLALAFLSRQFYWTVIVGLIPLIIFCLRAGQYSTKQIIRPVYWSGFMYLLCVFAWELQTSPSRWTELQGPFAILTKIFVWIMCAFIASIGFWLLGRYIVYMKSQPRILILILPVVWALTEFIRVYVFSVVNYGPGASLSPNWNLGIVGLGLMPSPLVYLARFVGLYGMSMAVVAINIAIYCLISRRQLRTAGLTLAFLVLLSFAGYRLYQPSGKVLKVGAVHLGVNDGLNTWDPVPLPAKDLDLLVVPEYSLFFDNKEYEEFARQNFGEKTTLITSVTGDSSPSTNILTFYNTKDGIISQQPKTFLIAGGEYMPYSMSGLFKLINQDYLTESFNQTQQVKRGATAEHPVMVSDMHVGSLVCSGVLALNEYRHLTYEGAEVLTNSASLSLISSASLYHAQESYLTRFHTVANARPFIQASRSGESYILTSQGKYISKASGDSNLLSGEIKTSQRKTLYTYFGEWTLLVGGLVLVVATLKNRRKLTKK